MDAYVCQQSEKDRHKYGTGPCLTIDVGDEEAEQRKEHIAAGDNRILVSEEEGEGQDGSHIKGKRCEAQQNVDGCNGDGGGDPTEDEVSDMKMRRQPEDEIPESRMALITEIVEKELRDAEIAREEPSLSFIIPRLMPGDGDCKHDHVDGPHDQISKLPTPHEHECSTLAEESFSSTRSTWRA